MEETHSKIRKQFLFYFSDANLARDKFLQSQIENNDGWVDLAVLAKFKRVQSMNVEMSVIVEALQEIDSQDLELNAEKTRVRRAKPLPEKYDNSKISVYAKRFPETMTIDEHEAYWGQYCKPKLITILRRANKQSKGAVFVEVGSEEEARELLGQQLKYEGTELEMELKADYILRKRHEVQEKEVPSTGTVTEQMKSYVKQEGSVLKVTDISRNSTSDEVKGAFQQYGEISNLLYFKYPQMALIFFKEPVAKEAAEKYASDKTTVSGSAVTVMALEGDAEVFAWAKAKEKAGKRGAKSAGRGRGRGGRGGRGRDGQKREREEEKQQATTTESNASGPEPKKLKEEHASS